LFRSGFSRQNMRKYATNQTEGRQAFPVPAFIGEPSLWHLAEITSWLKSCTAVAVPPNVIEVSKVAAKINSEVDSERVRRIQELT
jgi:predicted DNA-binding transcriptional regulator AlpA